MELKAISTKYRGYNFRSRLEARWAVYFDSIGIEWEYEKEGYVLDGISYLPDFWLPRHKMWAEVKPDNFTTEEINKVELLNKKTSCPVLLLIGVPSIKIYKAIELLQKDLEDIKGFNYCAYSYILTNWKNRGDEFYGIEPADNYLKSDDDAEFLEGFLDVHRGVTCARSKRFEFGEIQ